MTGDTTSSDGHSPSIFSKASAAARFAAALLGIYLFALASYAFYNFSSTKGKLATYGLSDATATLLGTVVMLVALALPALAIVRIAFWRAKPVDFLAALALPLISWAIAQIPANFDATTGKALKFCAARPDGSVFCLDRPGIDPLTQKELVPLSSASAEEQFRRERGLIPRAIAASPATLEFFDPLTGNPKVWFSKSERGCFDLFDNPGVNPRTGDRLEPVTKAAVASIKACNRTPSPSPRAEPSLPAQQAAPGNRSSQQSAALPSQTPAIDIRRARREAVDAFLSECAQPPVGNNERRMATLMARLDALGPPLNLPSRPESLAAIQAAQKQFAAERSASVPGRDLNYVAAIERILASDPAAAATYYVDSLLRLNRIEDAEQEVYRLLRVRRPGAAGGTVVWYELALVRKAMGDQVGVQNALLVHLAAPHNRLATLEEQRKFDYDWVRGMVRQSGYPFDFDKELELALSKLR